MTSCDVDACAFVHSAMWSLRCCLFQAVRTVSYGASPRSTERVSQSLVAQPPSEPFGEGRGCVLCKNGLDKFGYRDVLLLRQFLTPDGLIIGRRQTGVCQKMQRRIARAIKRSRKMGLLPNFTSPPPP